MKLKFFFLPLVVLLVSMAACTQPPKNSQDLQEQTAQATAQAKRDVKAVAAGIREGWSRDKPLDINSASKGDLTSLPDVSAAQADRVIAGRPYTDSGELVTRHIMPKALYDKISDRIIARR